MTLSMPEGCVTHNNLAASFAEMGAERMRAVAPRSFHVLAGAMHSAQPGRVPAHAAADREVDPLTDVTSRLFVGLGPLGSASDSAEVLVVPAS
jgi:hypothetical protein